ncbi:hypothetical protein Q9966_013921 [Columba livia]|nr:hypothetical protein Q9966_013921 [Columba livia]
MSNFGNAKSSGEVKISRKLTEPSDPTHSSLVEILSVQLQLNGGGGIFVGKKWEKQKSFSVQLGCKDNDESETQDSTSTSEEEKDLGKEETAKLEESSHLDSCEGAEETCVASADSRLSTSEQLDYFIKYIAIVSYKQHQSYKDDFNAEYDEYRNLHARMESISRRSGSNIQRFSVMGSPTNSSVKCPVCYAQSHNYHKAIAKFTVRLQWSGE